MLWLFAGVVRHSFLGLEWRRWWWWRWKPDQIRCYRRIFVFRSFSSNCYKFILSFFFFFNLCSQKLFALNLTTCVCLFFFSRPCFDCTDANFERWIFNQKCSTKRNTKKNWKSSKGYRSGQKSKCYITDLVEPIFALKYSNNNDNIIIERMEGNKNPFRKPVIWNINSHFSINRLPFACKNVVAGIWTWTNWKTWALNK